ncbi:FAD-dependent oxidoreductase, partial [candidate division KSB1 bacterium]|nr:FAD-dependent oxidoreductase [candidate division KSB1 bacterium]
DVLVIGSSAAGLVASTTGKTVYPDKSFTVVSKDEKVLVPCGIPYVFGSIDSTNNNILPADKMFEKAGINLKIAQVVSIDRKNKVCHLKDGDSICYDKLVLGTGSLPTVPNWLKGTDMENVFTVPKNKNYLDEMQEKLRGCNKIVTIGAGFIGVELSDELNKAGKNITLVEILPTILGIAFDKEICIQAEEKLKSRGVNVLTGIAVKEILGDGKVSEVLLDNGDKLEADAVILSVGYSPNTTLAREAGLTISDKGFIKVDEYMRTEDPDIFAVGDCAEKRDFVTRKPNGIMLASTACAEARTAGMNLYKLSAVKTFNGTISIFSTAIGDTGFGVAGLTENQAINEGFDIITGIFEGMDKHPGTLPDTKKQMVKLIVGKDNGVILGGEVVGGLSAGELTNTIGFIIQNRMSLNSILTSQIGTHPLLTASPAGYPLLKAAGNAAQKIINNRNGN